VGSVVDMKTVMAHAQGDDLGNGWLKTNSAGSGAYALKSWKPNESVVLEANPDYRGSAAKMKRVVMRHVPEPSAQRLLIEKGDIDIARDLTNDQVAGLAGNKNIPVSKVPQATLDYVGLNLNGRQLQDVRVRPAID